MTGGDHHHELSREDLFAPYDTSIVLCLYLFLCQERVVDKLRTPQVYYHKRYDRVPTIDTCIVKDDKCIFEANEQYNRDRLVDGQVVLILKKLMEGCRIWYQREAEDVARFCSTYTSEYEEAATNYFIKYGDIAGNKDVVTAFMKQKHRLLWERRYGSVGQGKHASGTSPTTDLVARGSQAAEKAAEGESMFDIFKRRRSYNPPKEFLP
ncbi:unnamed protein product [Protopolystoma xenopodis]|uniref:NADH dehydrogenase [ubiquinone] 1 beta subcomplex subunit 10 n=1 Tax=Protopolystoma xenopodis TaxID=117903 RepID=A0A448WFX3_9PLAT|nr:unnamed protein product [Protopolystoma xenopodis]